MRPRTIAAACVALSGVLLLGCGRGGGATGKPTFTLAWSEYPSWSVFGVAQEKGLIGGKDGKLGKIEEKWGVRIDLKLLDYEPENVASLRPIRPEKNPPRARRNVV